MLFEQKRFFHPASVGSGPDQAIHKATHRKMFDLAEKLKKANWREKQKLRPHIRFALGELGASAEVTGGSKDVHITTATAQINHYLPKRLQISANHVSRKPSLRIY